MGSLKDKVESLVVENLPDASAELELVPQAEKLSGYVVWEGFYGKTQRERQKELWSVLRANLKPEEEWHLSAILTFTPAEINSLRDPNS